MLKLPKNVMSLKTMKTPRAPLSTINVSFIRHGQTEMNLKSIVQGHADSSLTPLGFEQASNFGKTTKIKFSDALCSDLGRTRQTINSILTNSSQNCDLLKNVVYTKNLRERNYGEGVDGVWSVEKYLSEAEKSGFPPREYEPPGKGIEKLGELEKRGLQGGFHKMSYFGAKTVIWAHFWVEKRDFMSFVGQLWSILVIL